MSLEFQQIRVERGAFSLAVDVCCAGPATGIFGPSGAGKSTLLALLCGLLRPAAGRIVLAGDVLDDPAAGIHVPTHRRRLGVVFQQGHLLPHRTVRGNLTYGETFVPQAERRLSLAQVVDLLELGALLDRRPATLSGGERQRVALGRALLCSPRLLILDEPLAALDRGLKRQIIPFLRRVRESCGIPLLHVSHDLVELLQVTDDLVLLDQGRIVAQGGILTLAQQPAVLPHLHDLGLVNVLRGTIAEHLVADGVSRIVLRHGVELFCPLHPGRLGDAIDLLLRPEDVALAAGPVPAISLQNQLSGVVRGVTAGPDRVLVAVDVGETLMVEVSPRAVRQLGLVPGSPVHCLFKTVAMQA